MMRVFQIVVLTFALGLVPVSLSACGWPSSGEPPSQQVAVNQSAPSTVAAAESQAPSYTVPTNTSSAPAFVPAARLTNYVVAHSEYSSPLGRRTVLSGVLSDDDAEQNADDPGEDAVVNVNGSAEPQR